MPKLANNHSIMGVYEAGGNGSNGTTTATTCNCCDMSLRCWCRWKWGNHQQQQQPQQNHHNLLHQRLVSLVFSSGFMFFLGCLVLYGSIGMFYGWLVFSKPYSRSTNVGVGLNSLGCQEDNEGSWSIGVFYGDSPFSLKPIEAVSFFFPYTIILFLFFKFFFSLFCSHLCISRE